MNLVKSPLNYTGNKYRLLEQMKPFFPKKINVMVDMFCGGATVGLNVDCRKVFFVDCNERVIGLLKFLSMQKFDEILEKIEKVIDKYGLSNSYKLGYQAYRSQCADRKDNNGLKDYNKAGYYRLRDDYNSFLDKNTEDANICLYVLMIYAFNNDIRFNSSGEFNLPVGKTDLNRSNVMKIKSFIDRCNQIDHEFICMNFSDTKMKKIIEEADFIYMDPPYLIGDAVYNSTWNSEMEYKLLDFIDYLIENKKNLALSNVMEKVGKTNEPLSYWCYKNSDRININDMDYNYKSSSYNKIIRNAKEREVLITNAVDYNEEN